MQSSHYIIELSTKNNIIQENITMTKEIKTKSFGNENNIDSHRCNIPITTTKNKNLSKDIIRCVTPTAGKADQENVSKTEIPLNDETHDETLSLSSCDDSVEEKWVSIYKSVSGSRSGENILNNTVVSFEVFQDSKTLSTESDELQIVDNEANNEEDEPFALLDSEKNSDSDLGEAVVKQSVEKVRSKNNKSVPKKPFYSMVTSSSSPQSLESVMKVKKVNKKANPMIFEKLSTLETTSSLQKKEYAKQKKEKHKMTTTEKPFYSKVSSSNVVWKQYGKKKDNLEPKVVDESFFEGLAGCDTYTTAVKREAAYYKLNELQQKEDEIFERGHFCTTVIPSGDYDDSDHIPLSKHQGDVDPNLFENLACADTISLHLKKNHPEELQKLKRKDTIKKPLNKPVFKTMVVTPSNTVKNEYKVKEVKKPKSFFDNNDAIFDRLISTYTKKYEQDRMYRLETRKTIDEHLKKVNSKTPFLVMAIPKQNEGNASTDEKTMKSPSTPSTKSKVDPKVFDKLAQTETYSTATLKKYRFMKRWTIAEQQSQKVKEKDFNLITSTTDTAKLIEKSRKCSAGDEAFKHVANDEDTIDAFVTSLENDDSDYYFNQVLGEDEPKA